MLARSIWLTVFALACCSPAAAEVVFVRILQSPGNDAVGVLISEQDNEIRIYDFKTQQEREFQKDKVLKIEKSLSDEKVISHVGLPTLVAYRIEQIASKANHSNQAKAKVAQITPTAVYINAGSKQGIQVGHKVGVFRPGIEITDPDTGKVLARERPKIAELEIFEVNETISKGRIPGGLEVALKPGDEIEAAIARFMVAVLPIGDDAGVETSGASAMREALVTALVKQKVPVVERSQLDKVLGEEALQNLRGVFDAAQAQQFGKQLGASMVVTGKIVAARSGVEAHLRLVNVATGEILLAASGELKEDGDRPVSGGKETPASSGKAIGSARLQELMKTAREARFGQAKGAIQELAETKSPAAAKFLVEEMLEKEYFTTQDALISMGSSAADAVAKMVEIGDFSTRIRAMKIFAKIATKKHIPLLKKLTNDIHLRSEAERTLKRLQSE